MALVAGLEDIMKLTFIGAAHEVTGSCTLLEACGKHILIDCGMEQGGDTYENCELPIMPSDIDAICLTHAHIDHSGMIPAMVAKGYCTTTTLLCRYFGEVMKERRHGRILLMSSSTA